MTVLPSLKCQHISKDTGLIYVPFPQTTPAETNSHQIQMLTCLDKRKEQSYFTAIMCRTFSSPHQNVLLHQFPKEHTGKMIYTEILLRETVLLLLVFNYDRVPNNKNLR